MAKHLRDEILRELGTDHADGHVPTRYMKPTDDFILNPPSKTRQLEMRKACGLANTYYQPIRFDENWYLDRIESYVEDRIHDWRMNGVHVVGGTKKAKTGWRGVP